ncbi:hypothetical protein [Pleurocapsa sp. PCC 7319]|uniref:hypothetical protein n=1 Tax=Pleurocapsa sp. PCC 7319 TaxID=118161 RepID=UPI00034A0A92|nr:hypothetical protein [Pleurocapsa sp. PCC 7319]
MTNEQQSSNFWITLPGILTGIAAVIAAILGTGGVVKFLQPEETSNSKSIDTTTITVPADSREGISYTNQKNERVIVEFKANGRWIAIPEENTATNIPTSAKGELSADGDQNFNKNPNAPCPGAALGALVILNKEGCLSASGKKGDFHLEQGETVRFLMNDVKTLYQDNKGSIAIELFSK